MKNLLLAVVSSIVVLIGIVSMLTPLPGGTFLIAGGMTTLICTSPRARNCLRYARTRVSFINRMFFWLEEKVGSRVNIVGNALRRTRPGNNEDSLDSVAVAPVEPDIPENND